MGIGVGNENSKASLAFTGIVAMIFITVLKLFNIDIHEAGTFFILSFVLIIFFGTYLSATSNLGRKNINRWLSQTNKRDKRLIGIVCLIYAICITILFLKINVPD